MARLIPFSLEDFFDKYEHDKNLINLASSDCLPWSHEDFRKLLGLDEYLALAHMGYPDPKHRLIPALGQALKIPPGYKALPTAGAEEAIAITMHWLAAVKKIRSIGLPSPAYSSFHGLSQLLNIESKYYFYETSGNWNPHLTEIETLAKTCDAIVVISPHNPTGHAFAHDDLRTLANNLAAQGKILILDEVFRSESRFQLIHSQQNIIAIGSLSKMYGLPGLRLGWLESPERNFQEFRTIQQYLTLSGSTHSTVVGTAVLNSLSQFSRSEHLQKNRIILREWATANTRFVTISPPQGGTTTILEIKTKLEEGDAFGKFLQAGILLAPGSYFGFPIHPPRFRLGYGLSTDDLIQGLHSIAACLEGITT